MAWKAITEHELISQVHQAVEQMENNEREKFMRIQIPMYRLTCRRSDQYGDEWLIAVARLGNKLIVFDDVEDEFGIVSSSGDPKEVFHDWCLIGTLENALKAIEN